MAKLLTHFKPMRRNSSHSAQVPIPKGKAYNKFLNDINNKDELFQFLADELMHKMTIPGCNVVTTKREHVLSTKEINTETLAPCDHEEGDTRVLLHLKHVVLEGHKKAFIRTVDTDLVVIAVST